MFIDFWLICFIEERSLHSPRTFPVEKFFTWRLERFQVSLSFDNRYADRKFKVAFRTSETKNGNVHYYFEVEFKFWNNRPISIY